MKKGSKKIIIVTALLAAVGVFAASASVSAQMPEKFRSRGVIHFKDAGGGEVIFDAGDLDVLFQYAAEGKNAVLQALSGIGTKFVSGESGYAHTRNTEPGDALQSLDDADMLQKISFPQLLQALADSQKIPEQYADTCALATADNLTLGRAAWADGSLVMGNNHDVIESYLRGWMEGKKGAAGYKAAEIKAEPQEWETYVHAAAQPSQRPSLRSRGSIRYGEGDKVIFDAADLADIDSYLAEQKDAAAQILLQLGTRFSQTAAGILCQRNPGESVEPVETHALDWRFLGQAIEESQTVPENMAVMPPIRALRIEGIAERTDVYETASADNISLGKGVWADGKFIVGNGADCERAYQRGRQDGAEEVWRDIFIPIITINDSITEVRHRHVGTPAQTEGRNGCYRNYTTTRTEEAKCGTTLDYLQAVYNPIDDTWHGGFYTCTYHGGVYNAPGQCTYKISRSVTVWNHEIVCGLTDVVYGRIHLHAAGEEKEGAGCIMVAVSLEEADGFGHFLWKEGDKFLWEDENGNVLGTGSELPITASGVYRCRLQIENGDVDNLYGQVNAEIIGLQLADN